MSSEIPATLVFYVCAFLALGGGLGVALSRNILHAALALLATLGGVAGIYVLLGADFLGVAQLLIYVGGILLLLLFAVLLTSKIGQVRLSNRSFGWALALPLTALAAAGMIYLVRTTSWPETEAVATPMTARLGDGFLREFLLPFELISLLLLMALVGAMVLARRSVKASAPPSSGVGS